MGCLLSMASTVSEEDPCPQIPKTFVDRERMRKISREIKGFCVPDEKDSTRDEVESQSRPGQPEVLVRSVVATREDVHAFGKQLAAAAWQRGFAAASRKAFVGDGQEANWTVWRTPLLPLHADPGFHSWDLLRVCGGHGWPCCKRGLAGLLPMGAMDLGRRGPNGNRGVALSVSRSWACRRKDEAEESPRSKVADALRYLENQKSRMHYDQYRRAGLPITSSHIESTIKQINRRVKGSEKFWSEGGAEALCNWPRTTAAKPPLTTFWRERPGRATGKRHYQTAG